MVWLDLANAYRSVPHKLIDFALEFFYLGLHCGAGIANIYITGLFGRNALHLPLNSVSIRYKFEKARFVVELKESRDKAVRSAAVDV